MMKLRSIELALPNAAQAAEFMTAIWGLLPAAELNGIHYLRGTGEFPYLVSLRESVVESVDSVTFVADASEIACITKAATEHGTRCNSIVCDDLGGGAGIVVEGIDGELFRFIADAETVEPQAGRDIPTQLTHVVFNATDAEASAAFVEQVLGFTVSDRTKAMVFVRCNNSHHSTAFARAGFASLNHIAFEMEDLDAVMRGIGRMRDHGYQPSWGPGRHGPGDNAFAYYIAPFGPVIEYSTAVEKVTDDYRAGLPDDWTWPPNRIDQWGISDKDVAGLKAAEQRFTFERSRYRV